MNGRQAAKAAALKIRELENYNARSKIDIQAYNKIIVGLISGEINPCDWCEEKADCERPLLGKGCSEWWLAYDHPVEEESNDSEGLPFEGSNGRA